MIDQQYQLLDRRELEELPPGPLYSRIYQLLRQKILARKIPAGTRLPATRTLSRQLRVSRNTVLVAYDQLMAEGYVESRQGSGSYVAELAAPAYGATRTAGKTASKKIHATMTPYARRASREIGRAPMIKSGAAYAYDFTYGQPPASTRTNASFRRRISRLANTLGSGYGEPSGLLALRVAISRYLLRRRGVQCDPDQVIITNGAHQALDLIARAFVSPQDNVLIEEPHYVGARSVFKAAGARLVACRVDDDGLQVENIPGSRTYKLAYITPSHQFPTGSVMPVGRRLELLNWAQRNSAYVIEDDYDSEFTYTAQPVDPIFRLDRNDLVLYVASMSKSLCPSIRLGYMVVPTSLAPTMRALRWANDRGCSTILQAAVAGLISSGDYEKHLRQLSKTLSDRREVLLASIRKHFSDSAAVSGVGAGMHVALMFSDPGTNVQSFVETASRQGIGITSIDSYYLGNPRRKGILLGYGLIGRQKIPRGIQKLADLFGQLC